MREGSAPQCFGPSLNLTSLKLKWIHANDNKLARAEKTSTKRENTRTIFECQQKISNNIVLFFGHYSSLIRTSGESQPKSTKEHSLLLFLV